MIGLFYFSISNETATIVQLVFQQQRVTNDNINAMGCIADIL
jgi:hypothetical protein